jgi:peptidoglycan hydrolase-like protein with peptidoglycan-binding domain
MNLQAVQASRLSLRHPPARLLATPGVEFGPVAALAPACHAAPSVALISRRFAGVPELEACAVDDSAHLLFGSQGPHVALVQRALIDLGEQIETGASGSYGSDTEAAVSAYKTDRQILNFAGQIDPIVGKKTIAVLDAEIEQFDAEGGSERRTRLRFAGLDDAVETSLGFDEVVQLVETALTEGTLIRLPPSESKRALNPRQLVAVERI